MKVTDIEWEADAEEKMEEVPFFVRHMAMSKVEKAALKEGIQTITLDFVYKIRQKETGKGKDE